MRKPWLFILTAFLTVALTSSALAGANRQSGVSKLEARMALAVATHLPHGALPPDGVFTCAWIAEHPREAQLAMVSCTPAPPGRAALGDLAPDSPDTYPHCHYIPAEGHVGQGVFAWSHYEYAHRYDINAFNAGYYTWYIQKTDGTNQYWLQVINDLDTFLKELPANVRRSGAQNHSSTPERWLTCFDFN